MAGQIIPSSQFTGGDDAAPTSSDTGMAPMPQGTGKIISSDDFIHGSDKAESAATEEAPSSSALASFGHHFVANLPGGEDIAAAVEAPFTGRSVSEQKRVFQETGARQWEEHPWASGLGVGASIAGQVAALPIDAPEEFIAQGITRAAPSMIAPAAAKAAPTIARTAVGAGYGAIEGGTSGPDLWDWEGAGEGALTGGAGAAVAPAIVKGIGAAGRYAGIGSGKYEGAQKIVKAFEADQPEAATAGGARPPPGTAGGALDRPDYMAAKAAGQPVQAVDLGGENVRELADEAQLNSPAARKILKEAADQRFATQQSRFSSRIDDAFPGLNLNTAAQKDEIAQAARQQNTSAYRAAYGDPNAQAVWSNDLATMMRDPNVQAAIPKAQRMAASAAVEESLRTGNPVQFPKSPFVQAANGQWNIAMTPQGTAAIPSLQWWDQINRALGDQVSKARRAGNMNMARVVGNIQGRLQDELDAKVPQFAQARASAAGFFGEQKLVDSAIKFDKTSDENTLNSLLSELKGQPGGPGQRAIPPRSAADQEVFARAYATQLKQRIANQASSVDMTNQLLKDLSVKKIREGLNTPNNPTRGDDLVNWLRREDRMDTTRTNYGNSKTAQRLAAQAKHGQGHGLVGQVAQSFAAPGSGAIIGGYGGWESTPEGASLGHTAWNVAKGAGLGAGLGWLTQRRGALNEKMWRHVATQLRADNPNVYTDAKRMAEETPRYIKTLRRLGTVGPGMVAGPAIGGGPFRNQ